jgi:hypothetical protein
MILTASAVVSTTRYHDGSLIPYLPFTLYFRNLEYELNTSKYHESTFSGKAFSTETL